jgi:O-antigen ligase
MRHGPHDDASGATRFLFAFSSITLVLALFLGGGQGTVGEQLLALPGLALILIAGFRIGTSDVRRDRARWFWLLPAALVVLPLLQLVPLPFSVWTMLPGRGAIATGLATASVAPAAGSWTLAPFATEQILWSALVPAGLFMSAVALHGSQRRTLVGIVLAFAAISALFGLWQLMEGPESGLYLYRITNEGEAVGFFANRNHLAGLLAAALPVAAGMLADRLRHHPHGMRDLRVWLLTALIVLLAVSATATHSRAGFGLLMVSVIASVAVLLRARPQGTWAGARPWLRVSALIAGVLIVQFTLYGLLVRLEADPLDRYRWTLAANTLQAAEPAHGTGLGLGSFLYAYDEIGDESADIEPYVNHAHDDYVELWLEGGLPAAVLGATALALIGWQLRKNLRSAQEAQGNDTSDRGLRLGAAFALLLIALHSIVDYPLRTLTVATFSGLLAAVLLGSVRRNGRRGNGVVEKSMRTG